MVLFSAWDRGALGAGLGGVIGLFAYVASVPEEKKIREKIGPLPWDNETNEAKARKKFLGE